MEKKSAQGPYVSSAQIQTAARAGGSMGEDFFLFRPLEGTINPEVIA
jgi:hypothetical protein